MKFSIAKILILFLLISALVCGFAACNNDTDDNTSDGSSQGDQGSQGGDQTGNQGNNQPTHTHSGGTATCTDRPICEDCGKAYGSSLGGEHAWNYECSVEGHKQVCTRCSETVISEYDKQSCSVCKTLKTLTYALSNDRKSYIVKGIGSVTDVNLVIPSVYNQLPITAIGEKAFYGCESIVTVTLPEKITSIGQYAFSGCSNMTEINLPDSLTDIGGSAFGGCEKLGFISIPEGIKEIKSVTFSSCKSLSITLPAGLEKIGDHAFAQCGFSSIDIPDGVTEIGNNAFRECETLESIEIPDSVITIGSCAFEMCTSLADVTMGKGVTYVDIAAFAGTAITDIVFPDGVDALYKEVFRGCSNLKSVTARGVTKVFDLAFAECANLETLILSDNIEHVNWDVFYNATQAFIKVYDGMKYFGMPENPYAVLMGRDDKTRKDVIVHQDTTVIAAEAFKASDVESVTMGDSVVNIGYEAFHSCRSLISAYIGDGVENIEDNAFSSCKELSDIHWGSSIKSIGESAFYMCHKITSIELGESVEVICEKAFYYMPGLTAISVSPDNEYYYSAGNCLIEKATKKLVRGCGNSVIPDDGSIAIIGNGAFSSSELPDVIYIPDSVTTIGESAFQGSNIPSTVIFGKKLKEIYHYAFGAYSDTSITIYYEGNKKDWERVRFYAPKGALENAQIYLYSEEEPAEEGNFWRYVDGVPTPW